MRESQRRSERGRARLFVAGVVPLLLHLAAAAAWAQTATQPSILLPSAADPVKPAAASSEVAGFFLQGKLPFQKVKIGDMDMLVVNDKDRYVPLRRLLKAMGIKFTDKDDKITFASPTGVELVIDPSTRMLTTGTAQRAISLIETRAPIAQEIDVFVPMELADELFGIHSVWVDQDYQIVSRTERSLEIWKYDSGNSLLSAPVREIPPDLPEMFPEAQPSPFSLDFIEVQARSEGQLFQSKSQSPSASLDSLEQSFWGSLHDGRYKLTFAEPAVTYDQTGLSSGDQPVVTLKYGDLTFRNANSELVFGDSSFGYSDLIFPFVQMTGVRFNGLFNAEDYLKTPDASLGAGRFFGQFQEFQGFADVGSKAELFINDRKVAEDEVLTATPGAQLGQGLWRFKDIQIPSTVRNDVRIVVTSPSGISTQIERAIMGTSYLVPNGATAVLAGMGTSRDPSTWNAHGFMIGSRVLYGASPILTIGGTTVYEYAFNKPVQPDPSDQFFRQFPQQSTHSSAEFTYMPFSVLMMNGELAGSYFENRDDAGSFADSAMRLQTDFAPADQLSFHNSLFRFGSDYFNGVSNRPYDREGAVLGAHWKPAPQLSVSSSAGEVYNNLNNQLDQTIRSNFQSFRALTSAIWHTNLTFEYDRIGSNSASATSLYIIGVDSSNLPWNLDFNSYVALGNTLTLPQDSDFFSGINVPDLPLFESPTKSFLLRKTIDPTQTLTASYQEGSQRKRLSAIHNIRLLNHPFVVMRTEFGQDLDINHVYFDSRIECVLNPTGQTRVGFEAKLEDNEWSGTVYINLTELFANDHGHLRRITDLGFTPDYGAVQGHVVRDINANGIYDPGEQGVADVKVVTPGGQVAVTDSTGYYIIQSGPRPRQDRIFLDVNSVPADLSPINGIQRAAVASRTMTEVNLAVCPLHSVVGHVFTIDADKKTVPIPGVRIYYTALDDSKVLGESFTANDGSYYLGNVRPGNYLVLVDPKSLPEGCVMPEFNRTVRVEPHQDAQEFTPESFIGGSASSTQPSTRSAPTTQPAAEPPPVHSMQLLE